jgi:hypothetical protein
MVVNNDFVGTPELIQTFNGAQQVTTQVGAEPFPRLTKFNLFAEYNAGLTVNTGIALVWCPS